MHFAFDASYKRRLPIERSPRLHRRSVRSLTAVTVCFTLTVSLLVLGLPQPSHVAAQVNNNLFGGNERQGEPPRPVNGPVGAELPNTNLMLSRPRLSPQIQPAIPSTQPRYRHPRLGPRGAVNGQAVGGTITANDHEGLKSDDAANIQAEKSVKNDESHVLALAKGGTRLTQSRSKVTANSQTAVERSHARAAHPLLPQNPYDFPAAMLDPHNRMGGGGDDLLSENYDWALGILSLKGRAGLDLGLSLSYNSLATWVRSGNYLDFDYDNGFPTPGFRLSFPVVDGYLYYNSQAGAYYYLLFTPSGARVELRRVSGSTNVYEAVDSSYLQLTDNGSYLLLRSTDGSQLKLYYSMGQYRCTEIKDRNGNFITINYNSYDTLSISFSEQQASGL